MPPSRSRRKRNWRAFIAPVAVIVAILGVALLYLGSSGPPSDRAPALATAPGATAPRDKPVERTAALPPVNLPTDEGTHQSGMEWWYYSGILDAKPAGRYAFHAAVFVANGFVKHTVMHVALTDLQNGKRYDMQTRTGGVPAPAQGASGGFDFSQERWRVAAHGPAHTVRTAFDGFSIALDMTDSRPAVLHRAVGSATPGLLDFGSSGISYYYSRPRMPAHGEIVVGGLRVPVSGDVWFDHQWGDFDVLKLGWNWFALHLKDGSDVMLYQLFDGDGRTVTTAGTVSTANGTKPLDRGDIEVTAGKRWTSPRTRIDYPIEWRVKLPSGLYEVKPFFPDGEFDSRETTANVYWEGPVKVTDLVGGAAGEGFLELSGYDRLPAARAKGK